MADLKSVAGQLHVGDKRVLDEDDRTEMEATLLNEDDRIEMETSSRVLHKYKIADIPSTVTGSAYFQHTFTVTRDCTILMNASASIRMDSDTHDYCRLVLDNVQLADGSGTTGTNFAWANNHTFAGIWADVTAGSHTIKITNNGGATAHGSNNTDYDGWLTIQEM